MNETATATDILEAIDLAAAALRTLQRFGRRQALARDAGSDIAPAVLELLDAIDGAGLAVAAELADMLGIPASRVRLLAGRATAAGLILTTYDEWDGRHVVFRLTELGQDAVAALHAARADALMGATLGWQPAELAALGDVLDRLATAMIVRFRHS